MNNIERAYLNSFIKTAIGPGQTMIPPVGAQNPMQPQAPQQPQVQQAPNQSIGPQQSNSQNPNQLFYQLLSQIKSQNPAQPMPDAIKNIHLNKPMM